MDQAEHDRRVDYIEFPATNIEETKKFYSEVFGWEMLMDPEFRNRVQRAFTGPDYGWMWPYKRAISNWYESTAESIKRSQRM